MGATDSVMLRGGTAVRHRFRGQIEPMQYLEQLMER